MDTWIIWTCLQLGGSGCYLLNTSEKIGYLMVMIMAGLAGVLLLYGTIIKIFTR